MNRALAYARQLAVDPLDTMRAIIVTTCALSLIAAGHTLPW